MEYEIGLTHRRGDFTIRISPYFNRIYNYINHIGRYGGCTENLVYNLDSVDIYGVELEINRSLLANLNGYFNYTYQRYSVETGNIQPQDTWYLSQLLPKNKVNLGLRYRPWKDTLFMFNLRYVDARESMYNYPMDSFVTVNLGFEQDLYIFDQHLKLKGWIDNLFDEDYEERYHYPMPDRTLGMSLKYIF